MVGKVRVAIAAAAAAATLLGIAACGNNSNNNSDDPNAKVTLNFWQNSTTGDGVKYWENVIKEFEAKYPNITVKMSNIQNEDMDGKLQTGLQDPNSGPDVFLSRGGQKLTDVVEAGQVLDVTDLLDPSVLTSQKAALGAETVDGKIYGVGTAVQPGGFWYSKDLFTQAGIDTPPTTMDEFNTDIQKLKDANITPIALGGKDAWPAAHYWYWFALRECTADTFTATLKSKKFDDPCWTKAGDDVAAFVKTNPFNEGWLTTSAQQGAASSAGLLANHQAAMELMGGWEPGVIGDLTSDGKPLADLGFFPFPSVEGEAGDPAAMMGGVDGYSCASYAPKDACVKFLNFMADTDNQKAYYTAFSAIPANTDAQSAVTDPVLQDVLKYYSAAPSVSMWLDSQFGTNVGNALNSAVVNLMLGKTDAKGVVDQATSAAAK